MHIQTVNIHLGHSGLSTALLRAFAASFAPPYVTPASEPTKTPTTLLTPPAIGKYWQGQGGVFAGVGRGQDGKRDHCLIVPTDPRAMFDKRMLGTYGIDVPNANSYHDGPTNTQALTDAGGVARFARISGPVTVTAGKAGMTTISFVNANAARVSIGMPAGMA